MRKRRNAKGSIYNSWLVANFKCRVGIDGKTRVNRQAVLKFRATSGIQRTRILSSFIALLPIFSGIGIITAGAPSSTRWLLHPRPPACRCIYTRFPENEEVAPGRRRPLRDIESFPQDTSNFEVEISPILLGNWAFQWRLILLISRIIQ